MHGYQSSFGARGTHVSRLDLHTAPGIRFYPVPETKVSSQKAPPRYMLGKGLQNNYKARRNKLSLELAREIRAWADRYPDLSMREKALRIARLYGNRIHHEHVEDILRGEAWAETAGREQSTPSTEFAPIWLLMLPEKLRLVVLLLLTMSMAQPTPGKRAA